MANKWHYPIGGKVDDATAERLDSVENLVVGDRVVVNVAEYVSEMPVYRTAVVVAKIGLRTCVRLDDGSNVVRGDPDALWFRWQEVRRADDV